jgi:hypothetical protein
MIFINLLSTTTTELLGFVEWSVLAQLDAFVNTFPGVEAWQFCPSKATSATQQQQQLLRIPRISRCVLAPNKTPPKLGQSSPTRPANASLFVLPHLALFN